MKHIQTFEGFKSKDNILKEDSSKIKIGNLTVKKTKDGVEITRQDYNSGLIAESFFLFKNEIDEVINFLQNTK